MSIQENTTILVTGASGQLGRLTLDHLLALGVKPENLIAATRKPEDLAELAAKGVTVRAADFDNADSLVQAFAGVDRLLLISTNSLVGGVRLAQHTRAVDAAKRVGVRHVVYTSMPRAESSLVSFASDHAGTESALAASGVPHTILRNNWYAENLFLSIPAALASGNWYTASGQGKTAYISRSDLAYAAAVALIKGEEVAGEVFTLSGERGLTTEEIAALVSARVSKALAVVHVPVEAIQEGMKAHGFPEAVAEVFASFDVATAAGDLDGSGSDFERLTGRSPVAFEHWLASNASAF